ncbi:putative KAT8 regulatory NSL complex subunit 3/Testis-expressed sequence 30 protein [Helianthus annuus]|nr:putative KAT8 regulatory NSL complex subunit 3/Testis-expressed sequence 30 protein [Helianthus annuus]
MAPKRRRTVDNESKEAVQNRSSMVTRSRSAKSVKISDNNNSPVVVFAHGAGAPSSSEWMIRSDCYF